MFDRQYQTIEKNDHFLYYVYNYFQKKRSFSTIVLEKKNGYIDFLPIM